MRRLVLAGGLVAALSGGCATAPAPTAEPRPGSPEALRAGPSLHETGRFGVVPVSNGGIRIEEAGARPSPVEQPAAKPRLASGVHKPRAAAETPSKRRGRRRTSPTH
ncbi:MAG TPA: hypothetical protein VHG72_08970 [Polyangia bacterium]|nr:hypothetical protein [Polyangia bacterium]